MSYPDKRARADNKGREDPKLFNKKLYATKQQILSNKQPTRNQLNAEQYKKPLKCKVQGTAQRQMNKPTPNKDEDINNCK